MRNSNENQIRQFIVNCGHDFTNDIFILEGNVYWRLLEEKQTVIQHPGGAVSYCTRVSNAYLAWCYTENTRRYITHDCFNTQFKIFKFLKDTHENFIDDLTKEILDHDLSSIAILSEHLF